MKQDNATTKKQEHPIELNFDKPNKVEFDIEIGQGNISPLTGGELSLMTIETGYQNTIWRNNWISIPTYANSGGLSLGISNAWGEINFSDLDPWADVPSIIANASIEEISTSVGPVVNFTRHSGKGYNNGGEIFSYKAYGIGVGSGVPISISRSVKTLDVKFGWLPSEIDTIYTALNNPSHPISDSIIRRKGLNMKNKIDSVKMLSTDLSYKVNKDSLNKVLGNGNSNIKDFFGN